MDLPYQFNVHEFPNSGFSSLDDSEGALSLLHLNYLADHNRCLHLISEWVEDDIAEIACVWKLQICPKDILVRICSHFEHAMKLDLSAIEYRLWALDHIDARLLRYTDEDAYLRQCAEPAWWE